MENGSIWERTRSKSTTKWPLSTKLDTTRSYSLMQRATKIRAPPLKTRRPEKTLPSHATLLGITSIQLTRYKRWRCRSPRVSSLITTQRTSKRKTRSPTRIETWTRTYWWETPPSAKERPKRTSRCMTRLSNKLTRCLTLQIVKYPLWPSNPKHRSCSILNKIVSNSLKITTSASLPF